MKKLTVLLIAMIVFSIFIIPASASSDVNPLYSCVMDRDDNLTADEEIRITDKLKSVEIDTDIIFLVAIYDISEGIPSGESVVSQCGLDIYSDDIVLLIIEAGSSYSSWGGSDKHYYEMFTWGVADTVITDNAVDAILDDSEVYNNIKGGRFSNGILALVEQTVGCIKSYRRNLIFRIILISVVAAAVAMGIVLYKYKKKLKSPVYPTSDYATLNLSENTDIFLGKTVTRTRINTSSGGSGGRSGGGGGGSRGRR